MVLHGHCGGEPGCKPQTGSNIHKVGDKSWWEKGHREHTLVPLPTKQFQRKDVSHLGDSGEKCKNIKQIQTKCLEKKQQKWQKLFGGLELQIGF